MSAKIGTRESWMLDRRKVRKCFPNHKASGGSDQLQDQVHVSEMPDGTAVPLHISAREGAPPDDVVPGVERQFDLEAVALGIVFDHGGAFPARQGAAVILHHHEGTVVQHAGPFRYEHGIEVHRLPDLVPFHDDQEIRDGRGVKLQLRFRGGRKVFYCSAFDEKFTSPREPAVELAVRLERAEDEGLEVVAPAARPSGAGRDETATLAPVGILPATHLQRLVFRIGIPVDDPDGAFAGHFLIHDEFLHGPVLPAEIADVPDRIVAGIERDDGCPVVVEQFRIRPVDLDIRRGELVQEGLGVYGAGAGEGAPDLFGQKVPQRDHSYWNNTNTWEPRVHALYSFGGYGHYHFKNELIVSYLDNPEKNFRTMVADITPRYSATSYIVDSLLYVFGGRGNLSGKQELSPKNYYDLYTINTRTLEVRQLWDMGTSPFGDFVSSENFVYNWANGDFYFLSNLDGYTLLKLRPEQPGLEKMSLPIPPLRNAQYTYINLWHSYSLKKMFAVILQSQVDGSTDVDIYEIGYPPLPVSMIMQEGHAEPKKGSGLWWKILLGILGLVAAVDYVFYRFLRNKVRHRKPAAKESLAEREENYEPERLFYDFSRSSVNFFGGFRVTDREGNDVTAQFTPTVKALLILLIVSTAKSGGIASQKINHLLWSYKPDDTANNNRNVYMSKLRGLLEGVGDIRIQNQNKLWSISFEGDTQCDYLEALRLFQDGAVEDDVDRLLELFLKGQMLPNTELDWIDEYKSAFSNAAIDFLSRQLQRGDLSDKTLLQAANTIFQHDFLNEDALRAKIRILCRENKPGLAKTIYDNFCKEYRKSLGIEYTVPFKQMIEEE